MLMPFNFWVKINQIKLKSKKIVKFRGVFEQQASTLSIVDDFFFYFFYK